MAATRMGSDGSDKGRTTDGGGSEKTDRRLVVPTVRELLLAIWGRVIFGLAPCTNVAVITS